MSETNMERVTMRFPTKLLEKIENEVDRGMYPNRSEAIRQACREYFDGGPVLDREEDRTKSWKIEERL